MTQLWTPPPDVRSTTEIGRYLTRLALRRGLTFESYAELWQWSVTDLEAFWSSIWDHFGVLSHTPHEAILAERTMPGAVWFPGARSTTPSTPSAPMTAPSPSSAAPRPGRGGQLTVRRAARPGGPGPGRPAAPRRGPGRPGGGLPPEHPRDRWSPSSPPPASVRCGRRARPSSAPAASSTASTRSSPKSCSAVDGYRYGGRVVDRRAEVGVHPGRAADPGRPPWSSPTSARAGAPARARSPGPSCSRAGTAGLRRRSPSTTRSTSCTPRAPPGCPSRSCTATAASSSST